MRSILSNPERPSGPSLEEQSKSKSICVPSQPHIQPEGIQTQDSHNTRTQRESVRAMFDTLQRELTQV